MRVDLNGDVGESFGVYALGDDAGLMPHLTSANIACGFHAGSPAVMRATLALAISNGVTAGAHPGFRDLEGFGRRALPVGPREVEELVIYQVGALSAFAAAAGTRLGHVKPHGALYNMAAADPTIAEAIASAVRSVDRSLVLVGLAGSALIRAGIRAGLATASEVFADRAYAPDGTLLPRGMPGAVIRDEGEVQARAVAMVRDRAILAADGTRLSVEVDTICVHGDTPGAAALARGIRQALTQAGIDVKPLRRNGGDGDNG